MDSVAFCHLFCFGLYNTDFSERGRLWYAGITYVLLMTIYSFNNTPYSSLGGVMTGDIKERTSISTYRFVAATIATFVVQGLTLPLVSKFGQGDPRRGWLLTVSLFAVIVVVLFVITFFTTKERIEPPVNQKTSVKQDFKDIISNRPWKAMFVLTLFLFITLAMWGSSMSYYFNYVVDKDALFGFLSKFGLISEVGKTYGAGHRFLDAFGLIAYHTGDVFAVGFSLFNMVGQVITLLGVILLSRFLSNIFGKRNVFIVCLALTAVFTSLFYVVSPTNIESIFVINILKSLAYAPTIPLLWAMMGDVADYSDGESPSCNVLLLNVFALKAVLALVVPFAVPLLMHLDLYLSNQTDSLFLVLNCRQVLFRIFFIGVCFFFYPISKMNERIHRIEERRKYFVIILFMF